MKKSMKILRLALPLVCLALAAPAVAQTQRRSTTSTQSPLEAITSFKLRADPVEPADFVKRSRPPEDQLQYLPVATPKNEPARRVLTFDELKAAEADLDALRARQDRIGARPAPKEKLRSIAFAPKPKAPKKTVPCLITCKVEIRPVRE